MFICQPTLRQKVEDFESNALGIFGGSETVNWFSCKEPKLCLFHTIDLQGKIATLQREAAKQETKFKNCSKENWGVFFPFYLVGTDQHV